MPILVERIVVGAFAANCYVVAESEGQKAAVIDPGGDPEAIAAVIERHGLTVDVILNTHGHADHIAANGELARLWRAPIAIHRFDAPMLTNPNLNLSAIFGVGLVSPMASRLLEDGDVINIGSLGFRVSHTPGHTPGGVCFVVGETVFSGDTLFAGSIGRTDFPRGSMTDLLSAITEKLLTLPDRAVVHPGHGPETTIGEEKRYNPFLALPE